MAQPPSEQPDAVMPRRPNGWFSWLVLVLVATAAISLVAVYLPPRMKMLGLFAIAEGLFAGWIAARLALVLGTPAVRGAAGCGVVFLVLLGGQVGTTVESYRLYRAAEIRALAANPKRAAALRMLESVKMPDDPTSAKMVADARKTIGVHGTSFADYLQFRLSEAGVRSRRLATFIWLLEIGLGSLAGTWIFRRFMPAARLEAPAPAAKLDE